MGNNFDVSAVVSIPKSRVMDLLVYAFEGGSNYWMGEIEHFPPFKVIDGKVVQDPLFLPEEDEYKDGYWLYRIPLTPGGYLLINEDYEAKMSGRTEKHRLDLESIEKGLNLMAKDCPFQFANLLNENDDADTGDVFLQLALFEEIVYC